MNIFELAQLELQRENIRLDNPSYARLFIARAKRIRNYMDNKANAIKGWKTRHNQATAKI